MLNLERFRNEKIAIYCKNKEEWDMVITQLNAQNLNQLNIDYFDPERPCIVNGYDLDHKLLNTSRSLRGPRQALIRYDWEIVSVDDLMIPLNVEEYLKLLDNF